MCARAVAARTAIAHPAWREETGRRGGEEEMIHKISGSPFLLPTRVPLVRDQQSRLVGRRPHMVEAKDVTIKDPIDETNDGSFPASDPPGWTGTHAGPPGGEHPRAVDPAQNGTLRTVRASASVPETVARLERALAGAGMKVFARIDQAQEAQAVGLGMRPTVLLLFGNARAGTPLMIARPTVAIDLPQKALVWEDDRGRTWLTYNTPALLEERHGLERSLASKLAAAGELLERAIEGPM
jgi:uncharacterized protein (DUF302 family)